MVESGKKLSVIIPLYNVAGYAHKAAFSITSQAFEGLEIVLVDDGSTDASLERYMEYLADVDVVPIRQENAGPGAARNTGIKNASGELIMFLDADDFLLPGAFANILAVFESENPDVVFGRYHLWTEKKGLTPTKKPAAPPPDEPKSRTDYILCGQPEASWCPVRYVCQRDFLLKHNVFFKAEVLCEDVRWSIDLLMAVENNGGKISFLFEPFYAYYHRRPGSSMNTYSVKRLLDLNDTVIELLEIFKDRPVLYKFLVWESFFYINEYCLFKRQDRKLILEGYRRVLPLYGRFGSYIIRIAGKCQNAVLFYVMSLGLFSVKMLRRMLIHARWLLNGKPRVQMPDYNKATFITQTTSQEKQREKEASVG